MPFGLWRELTNFLRDCRLTDGGGTEVGTAAVVSRISGCKRRGGRVNFGSGEEILATVGLDLLAPGAMLSFE